METKLYKAHEYKNIIDDLLNGEVVGFPTETVYGLAIVYDDINAFNKIYEIKNRSVNKPISMMVADIDSLKKVAYVDEKVKKIIDAFMPGPLTIVLKAKENLPKHVTFNLNTIGIRIPNHQIALNILKNINKPLLVSSANISNEPSLIKASDVYEKFNHQIASLINEDAADGLASTVISLIDGKLSLLREGPISIKQIKEVIGE